MIAIVRMLFWRCRPYSMRDRALGRIFSFADGRGRLGRAFRIAVFAVGAERKVAR